MKLSKSKFKILTFLFVVFNFCACHDNTKTNTKVVTHADNLPVSIKGHDKLTLNGNLIVPEGEGPYPAVIVLHGCGGLYSDVNTRTMESHFVDWVSTFQSEKVVALFIDSYNPRGFSSFCSMAPPNDQICSPAYERTKDVNDALLYLSGLNYVDKSRIGLLGFSQGAETAIAAALNTSVVTKPNWTVTSQGVTYNVPAPAQMTTNVKIKAVVAYYPGLGYYGYFGSPKNSHDGKYLPVAPLLIHGAALDPLFTSGSYSVFNDRAILSGASVQTQNQVVIKTYDNANHSFDGAKTGADVTASQNAKVATLSWFKDYLKY